MKRSDVTQVIAPNGRASGALVAGRYRLAAHIGTGGSADVWRAYDESRDRPVTLKILRDATDVETRRHFIAEARRLETLDHPSLIPILGLQDTLDVTLIAYEQVEGEGLDHVVATRGPLPARRVALIILQLANAVEALHAHGFVHLDLKPANVLMGIEGRPRLIDFGIAEPIGHPQDVARGTPGYAAPEIGRGAAASRASDVYGLAAIARDLLGPQPTSRVAGVLGRGLAPDPARRYRRPRSFGYALAVATLLDDELSAIVAPLRRWRALLATAPSRPNVRRVIALARARPELFLRLSAVALVVSGLLLQQVQPAAQGKPAAATLDPLPSLVRASFEVPPLSSYAAAFESQASYPAAAPNVMVEWVVALRNTGSAGWYRGIDGAQASLILDDGTVVAVQSTTYVGPGQVGWFTARFRAPTELGTHIVRLRPAINGRGALADLGIHALVTVNAR